MSELASETKDKVIDLCQAFIEKHKISCAEACHDNDRVWEQVTTLLENICDQLGYYKYPD